MRQKHAAAHHLRTDGAERRPHPLPRRAVERGESHAAIVFQTFALFPWLTVQENVEVALKARGVPQNVATPRALDLIDKIGLDGFETAYPRELSGGMRQK